MCRFVGGELVNSEDNIPDRAGVGVLLKLEDLAAELSPIRKTNTAYSGKQKTPKIGDGF
jgi:hypothetical protein